MTKKGVVWKFDLDTVDYQEIVIPQGAKILCVQVQKGVPRLWILVDPEQPCEKRVFAIHGTGHHNVTCEEKYISTYQLFNDDLVFHVFEVQEGAQ